MKVSKTGSSDVFKRRKVPSIKQNRLNTTSQKDLVEIKEKLALSIQAGKEVVYNDKFLLWDAMINRYGRDAYCGVILEAALIVMKALSAGNSPRQALKCSDSAFSDILTPHQKGHVAQSVGVLHPRGQEYQDFWKNQEGFPGKDSMLWPSSPLYKSVKVKSLRDCA